MRSSRSGVGSKAPRAAAGVLAFVLVATLAWVGAADAKRSSRGPAMITGSFSDGCRDFTSHATKVYSHQGKDISYVEIHYADGRVVKDETVSSPDYSLDGAAGDEIALRDRQVRDDTRAVRLRAGEQPADRAPRDQDPRSTQPRDCYDFLAGGLACEQSAARTDWTSTSPDSGRRRLGFRLLPLGLRSASADHSLCSFTISFRGTSSSDPDNDIASWSIDFGDGTSASGSWSTNPPTEVAHTYSTSFSNCVGFGAFHAPARSS